MPELPDLQVFSKNLDKQLSGKKLKEIEIFNDKKLKTPKAAVKKSIEGEKLKEVYREGKELRFAFANGNILGMHLMLNGDLYLFKKETDKKNKIAALLFEDGQGLVLTDFQGMANISLNPEEKDAPDALSGEVDFGFLKAHFSKTRKAVKTLLLDQHFIRGIGNAYADEILWEAGISPFSHANKVPDDKLKLLAKKIHSVLKDAEHQILKKKPEAISGEVRDFLKIHNAHKKESPTGAAIEHEMLNSRKTYFTKEQELYE
jgi:formamidopyrimidine-DNA glycosylase